QKDLQKIFQTRGASITSLIQGLEKKKLITRKPSLRDGREKVVTLTKEGKQIVDEFNAFFPREDDKAKKILSTEEYKTLFELLSKIDDNSD
ncbi:MarR family transcriptional regulator, partial [Listeria ivanovii FSL F6-596]